MPNGNQRGSAADRRRRKRALLERDGTGPDGIALCVECPTIVDFESMIVDRIKPGCEGGRYGYRDLSNNQIHCERCSHRQGGRISAARRRARLEGTADDQEAQRAQHRAAGPGGAEERRQAS